MALAVGLADPGLDRARQPDGESPGGHAHGGEQELDGEDHPDCARWGHLDVERPGSGSHQEHEVEEANRV